MDPLAERIKKQRESQRISVAELAHRTKVREPYIHAIEQGMYTMLPAVYVRSFIKTLGSALGIPASELQRLISTVLDSPTANNRGQGSNMQPNGLAGQGADEQSVERTTDTVSKLFSQSTSSIQGAYIHLFRKRSSLLSRRQLLIGVAVLAVILITFVSFFNSSNTNAPIATPDVVNVTEDSLQLTAKVADTSEFTITIDNQRNEKVLLVPNEEYSWSAAEKFVINNIFNAGSISFQLNSKPLQQYAKPGEVLRELTITRKDVIASNAPVETHQAAPPKKTTEAVKPPTAATKASTNTKNEKTPKKGAKKAKQTAQTLITRTPQRPVRR